MSLKIFNALSSVSKKKDVLPIERLDVNKVRVTIETYCKQYLTNSDDIFRFEALPQNLDAVLSVLDSKSFQDSYEFAQETETIFAVRLRDFNIL